VGFRRRLAFSRLAASAYLSGILHAQSIYTIPIRDAGTPAKFELYVTYSPADAGFNRAAAREFTLPAGSIYTAPSISFGDWEVTVAVDVAHCGIYCAYRRKPEASGRTSLVDLLPPPVTAIRIYTGSAAKPAIVFVDPAGLGLPAAASHMIITRETLCIPGRKLVRALLAPEGGDKSSILSRAHSLSLAYRHKTTIPAVISLRI
jgi:hypothetical protein